TMSSAELTREKCGRLPSDERAVLSVDGEGPVGERASPPKVLCNARGLRGRGWLCPTDRANARNDVVEHIAPPCIGVWLTSADHRFWTGPRLTTAAWSISASA